jgi:hypothetical protein
MRWMLFLMLLVLACVAADMAAVNADDDAANVQTTDDRLAQNFTEHSWIFVNGYMEESRILQTDTGFKGQKIALTTSGSGMATRTIDSEVYRDSNREEASLTISANYDYRPYVPPLTQSDLRNALCAKNYEVGSVFSESYNIDKDLIKDTNIYQNDSFSVYQISSEVQGTARIGQRVQKNAKTVPSFMMNGMYVGYAQIRSETIVGNTSVLTLPCP